MTTSPPIFCFLLLSSSSARLGAMETPQTPSVCYEKFLDSSGIWESCSKVCGNLILGGSIDSLHNTNCKLLCQDCFDHYARRTTSTTQLVTTRSGISISDISISEYDVWKWKTTAIVMIAAFVTVLIANIIAISVYKRCQQGSTENPQDAEAQRNSGSSSPSGQNHSAGNTTARAQAHAHGPSRIPVVANGPLVSMQGNPVAPCTGDAANDGTLPETSARRIEGDNSVNDNAHPEAPTSSGSEESQAMAHIHSMPLDRTHPLEENISHDSHEAETHFIEENVSIENDESSGTPNSDDAGYTSAHTPSEISPLIEENTNDSQSE